MPQSSFTESEIQSLVHRVRATGCDQRARDLAQTYLDAARAALARLTEDLAPARGQEQLAAFLDHMRDREA